MRILRLIERAGYVVTKAGDHERREHLIAELQAELARRADREFRLGRERDSRELEAARAEIWEMRERITVLEQRLEDVRRELDHLNDRATQTRAPAAEQQQSDRI